MRMKHFYMPTLREVPAEAEIPSHQLMLRAAMMRKAASGIYSYLPLGYRVIRKIEEIVRKTMDKYGAQEILMSALQPEEIWMESGRWKTFGPEMFKLKDRNGRGFCLGPTAEEYFTDLVKNEIKSYKQLPLNIYQIQTKYRDEKRPRFGINRAREFVMKDAYTFDADEEAMKVAYQNMWDAYEEVFDTLGLDYRIVAGDSGAMGGHASHEFIALSDVGEGVICYCENCKYGATDEKAQVVLPEREEAEEEDLVEVHTPGQKTIEEVASFLEVDPSDCIKAVDLLCAGEPVIVLVPGDRELNLAKLVGYLGVPEHEIEMMPEEMVEELTGAAAGYTGPVGLEEVRLIMDASLENRKNLVCGANHTDHHYKNVNYKRDFDAEIGGDLLMIQEGDPCPECGSALHFARGIEVGNIFQLGTKYSESLGATFLDENGKAKPFVMGSYGIGVTRTVTAIIEQNHDDKGIIWPMIVAPYHAIVTVMKVNDEVQMNLAEKIYQELQAAGVEVLLDDRNERAGVKFNDRDLIGIPHRITVGKKADQGIVEYSTRSEMENEDVEFETAVERIKNNFLETVHNLV